MVALITDFHTRGTRSRAVGWHQMAIYMGMIVGRFSGYVADAPSLGWRLTFDVCGIFGMLYAVPLLMLLSDGPRGSDQSFKPMASVVDSARELLPTVPSSSWSSISLSPRWPPDHPGLAARDLQGTIRYQTGTRGRLGRDLLAVRVHRRTLSSAAGWPTDGAAEQSWTNLRQRHRHALVAGMFGVGNAGTLLFAAALWLFGLGWGFFDCNNMPILCQIVPPALGTTGYGIMNMVSISFGGFADWGFGTLAITSAAEFDLNPMGERDWPATPDIHSDCRPPRACLVGE